MDESSVQESKRALRTLVRHRRIEGFKCGDAHSKKLIELIQSKGFKTIAAFVEFDNEPDLSLLRKWCVDSGVEVLLPAIADNENLTWSCGKHNRSLSEAELIVIPAMAAGRDGTRLGRGKGYYDRALTSVTGLRVVVVHDEELRTSVPCGPHDEKVSVVVSCSEVIDVIEP